jgi:hypothetical protein
MQNSDSGAQLYIVLLHNLELNPCRVTSASKDVNWYVHTQIKL